MRKIMLAAVPLFIVSFAAAAADVGRPTPPGRPDGQMSESEVSLHDLMEPIWRAPKAERAARACANTEAIQARVDAAVGEKGTGPFLPMSKTANDLTRACGEKRMADVSKLLDELHRQFHKMIGME